MHQLARFEHPKGGEIFWLLRLTDRGPFEASLDFPGKR
jgi:hypothetical protein